MNFQVPVYLTLISVIAVARLMGRAFRAFGQPSVMGEVLGGILLGPSVLGVLAPTISSRLFNADAISFMSHIADIGIMIYLFIMGLEMDLSELRKSAKSATFISQASIAAPFLLGVSLSFFLKSLYLPPKMSFLGFSLFIGVSLSITAFPVLARILSDSELHKTRLGDLALTCAAINDITAWCLIAVVTGLLHSSLVESGLTVLFTILFILFMMFLVRPLIKKYLPLIEKNAERLTETELAFVIIGVLGSAAITQWIGIHALFGAFLFGAVIPHESLVARDLTLRLQEFVRVLLLPAFFALTGLKTQLGLLSQPQEWLISAIVILFAITGKFGGTYMAAQWVGHSKKESSILGVLMNTRGLVELIVLNIGLSTGILTPTLFTMLVIMALVTTFMTGPLLRRLLVKKQT